MLEVYKEPEELLNGPAESCIFCNNDSRYWHNKTNTPVCQSCAEKVISKEYKMKSDILNLKRRNNSLDLENIEKSLISLHEYEIIVKTIKSNVRNKEEDHELNFDVGAANKKLKF